MKSFRLWCCNHTAAGLWSIYLDYNLFLTLKPKEPVALYTTSPANIFKIEPFGETWELMIFLKKKKEKKEKKNSFSHSHQF